MNKMHSILVLCISHTQICLSFEICYNTPHHPQMKTQTNNTKNSSTTHSVISEKPSKQRRRLQIVTNLVCSDTCQILYFEALQQYTLYAASNNYSYWSGTSPIQILEQCSSIHTYMWSVQQLYILGGHLSNIKFWVASINTYVKHPITIHIGWAK